VSSARDADKHDLPPPTRSDSGTLGVILLGDWRHPWVAGTTALGETREVPYPPRPQLRPLPEFASTARTGTVLSREFQARLEVFVVDQYSAGRSLRQIGELVDRSQTAVRRILDSHQVPRRLPGAPPVSGRAETAERSPARHRSVDAADVRMREEPGPTQTLGSARALNDAAATARGIASERRDSETNDPPATPDVLWSTIESAVNAGTPTVPTRPEGGLTC